MRYNPATDNAVHNERVQAEMNWTLRAATPISLAKVDLPAEVEPEPEPELTETDKAVVAITYNLWNTSHALARLTRSEVGEPSIRAMIDDVEEVVRELRMLCVRV